MGSVDQCFREITLNDNLSTQRIQELLDNIYKNVSSEGVSSPLLPQIITFLCESSLLATTTKLYVIKHCLLPNDYVPVSVVFVVLRHLGTNSLQTMYKLQTPQAIQIELCKWLMHVYFLIEDPQVFERTYSIWFQMWQYGYLQSWTTYIIFWSTTRAHVRPWRVRQLTQIASRSGYKNAAALATLLMEKYQSLIPNEMIIQSISNLDPNARRLNSLKSNIFDENFHQLWINVLVSNGKLSNEYFQELTQELIDQVALPQKYSIDGHDTRSSEISLMQISTMETLARKIEHVQVPVNTERLIMQGNKFSMLYLTLLDHNHELWKSVELWSHIKFKLAFVRKDNCDVGDAQLAMKICHICLLYSSLLPSIEKVLITSPELLLCDDLSQVVSLSHVAMLLDPPSSGATSAYFLKRLVMSRLGQSKTNAIAAFTTVSQEILATLSSWLTTYTTSVVLQLCVSTINLLQTMLIEDIKQLPSNRHLAVTFTLLLKVLQQFPQNKVEGHYLKYLILPKNITYFLMTLNDPIIISSLTDYLVYSKDYLRGSVSTDEFVKLQNQYVVDITNYLWRNKIFNGEKLFDIPVEFIKKYTDNVYSSDFFTGSKSWFTIVAIPALSFACLNLLKDVGGFKDCKNHLNSIIFEKGFKEFKKQDYHCSCLQSISSFDQLKILALQSMEGHTLYNGVATFLFSYLKSLSDLKSAGGTY